MGREFYLFIVVVGLLGVVIASDVQELKEGLSGDLRIVVLNATGGSDRGSSCGITIYDPAGSLYQSGAMSLTGSNVRKYSFTPPVSNKGRWFANVSCNDGQIVGSQAFEFLVTDYTLEERIGNPLTFTNETGSAFQSIMDILRQIFFRQKRQLISVSGTALNGTGGPIISGTVTSWLFNCTTTTTTCGSAIGLGHASIINNGAYSFQFTESTIPGYVYKVVSNVTGDDQSVNLTTFING